MYCLMIFDLIPPSLRMVEATYEPQYNLPIRPTQAAIKYKQQLGDIMHKMNY